MNCIRPEVDANLELIFQEAEVFVAGTIERFNSGRNFKRFFDQSGV
jgi:hypothetical protein